MNWKTTASVGVACSVAAVVALINPSQNLRKISQNGLMFIGQKEGCRRIPYFCSADTLTSGIGHTTNVTHGSVASDIQIARWFISDIQKAEREVNKRVNLFPGPVYDMAVSFVFNLGPGNFRKSTFLKKLQRGDVIGACNEFPRWVYVQGKNCRIKVNDCYGIVTRRQEERDICLNGYKSG